MEVTPDGGTLVAQEIVNSRGTHDILVWRGPRSGALSGPEVISSGSTLRGGWIRPALAVTDGGRILMTWTRRTERHAGDVMLVSFDSVEGRSTFPRRLGRSSADGSAIAPAGSGAIVTWLSGRHIVGGRPVQALLARRLDGRARPTGARSTVSGNTRPEPVVAGLPGGAAATAWTAYHPRARRRRLWACRLVGTPVRCTNLTRLADDAQSQETRVKVGPGARVAVAWIGAVTADTAATPKLTMLTRAGRWTPVRDVPVAPSSRVWPPALLPAADGTFLVAEGRRLFRLAPTGVTGPVEELAGLPARTEDAMAEATGGGAMALATTTAAPSPGVSGFSTVWLGRG
ncbi:hypothetical protein LRS13_16170 [Svornostia abyssi]|uniref:Uncharacterized protein n=1 Tax=Svornostia abyssi TaxID=2898438 RepID=A0ABY5PCB0_9ACTN|nr:hypothetical protein LRS13_16170 [Parviterribacteraceae bacterium J379]